MAGPRRGHASTIDSEPESTIDNEIVVKPAARDGLRQWPASAMARRRFIIDTDAGLDDAAALFLAAEAHKAGAIEILAVTAVHGNTRLDNVVVNVARTLQAAGLPQVHPARSLVERDVTFALGWKRTHDKIEKNNSYLIDVDLLDRSLCTLIVRADNRPSWSRSIPLRMYTRSGQTFWKWWAIFRNLDEGAGHTT